MSLIDLISPKWKHSNPEIRLEAVKHLRSDELELLRKIAINDKDPTIRKIATERIDNKDVLKEIAGNDSDENVRDTAWRRLNPIYRELILEANDPDTRKFFLNELTDEEIMASLACQINDPDFRLAAVAKISSKTLLCTIAESNCGAITGDAIVKRISDPDLLNRISEKATNKKTRKKAMDKLDAMAEKENKPSAEKERKRALEKILMSLEIRLNPANWEKGIWILQDTETAWKELDPSREHPLYEKYSDARQVLEKQIKSYEKRDLVKKELEDLLCDIEKLTDQPSSDSKSQADIIQKKWNRIDKNSIPFSISQDLEKRFNIALEKLNETYEKRVKEKEQREIKLRQMKDLLGNAEELLETRDWDNASKRLDVILTKWQAAVFNSPDTSSLIEQFETIVDDYKTRYTKYREETEKELKEQEKRLRTLLEKVEKASQEENKAIFKSASIVKSAKNDWKEEGKQIPEIKNELTPRFQESCNTFYKRFNEYQSNRDWELWANLNQKTELCEIIESIAASLDKDDDFQKSANLVREAQAKWKKIGSVARDKSDDIWIRFRNGCDKIFSQCLEKKEALHGKLVEAVNISNYSEATEKVKEIQKKWNIIGMLPLSMEKDLRDSFQSICDNFFEQRRNFFKKRDDERNENFKTKEELCEQAKALSDSTAWNITAEKLKALQKKWKETGPVPKHDGDGLWEKFQTSCNTFFDNLEKIKPDNLKKKEELCENVDELLSSISIESDIETASRKVMELQREWKKIGPVPKENIESIWQRFHTSCEEIFTKRREYQKKRQEKWSDNQILKEKLVIKAEELSDSTDWENTPQKLKDLQAEWKNIEPASRKAEQELWERLTSACDSFFIRRRTFFENLETERQDNLKKKEDLCLTLELLSKILLEDSILDYNDNIPIAEQLSKAMELRNEVVVPGEEKVTRENVIRKVKQIQADWKIIGPVPNNYDRELWERFQKAGDLFYSSKKSLSRV